MNTLEKNINRIKKTISLIKRETVLKIFFNLESDDQFTQNILKLKPVLNSAPQSESEKIFTAAVEIMLDSLSASVIRSKADGLMYFAGQCGLFSFVTKNGEVCCECARINKSEIDSFFYKINQLLSKYSNLSIELTNASINDFEILNSHLDKTQKFFIKERGAWISDFIKHLGDDISRISFYDYLNQRMRASVFWDSPICYPTTPPKKTKLWRQERKLKTYDFPTLMMPKMGNIERGGDNPLLNLFYEYIFVYEQYAISGVCEAQEGDIVIDAGAFVGDTACYFSKKVGKQGTVYSFEAIPESISYFKQNMVINNCTNVEIIPKFLSDQSSFANFLHGAISASTSGFTKIQSSDESSEHLVETISLDDFVNKRKTRIDFIKADIEGSEMLMLQGASHSIQEFSPICAICLYHKKDDFWEIPEFLKSLRPNYQFYFRCETEPVLFAKVI